MNSFKDYDYPVDISHMLNPDTQTFPVSWHRKIEFTVLGTIETVGRNTTQVHIGTHSGTHIDSPAHFIQNGDTVEQLVLSRFVGDFDYVNFRTSRPKQEISVRDLQLAYDKPRKHRIIILDFGWSPNFGTPNYYSDQPFLSIEASRYLLSLEPKLLGYDVAMPDNPLEGFGSDCDSPVHKMFLSEGIPLLENLRIERPIGHLNTLVALPLKLEGLDGSPVRCVVF